MQQLYTQPIIFSFVMLSLLSCGEVPESFQNPKSIDLSSMHTAIEQKNDLIRWKKQAQKMGGVTLTPPDNFEPDTHMTLEFMRWENPPASVRDFPHASRELTQNEGRKLFFDGLLPMVLSANNPSPTKSEFGQAIKEGLIVGPACATTNSQVLEYAARKSGLTWLTPLFDNPWGYLPTHNNEYQLMLLGWHYFLMDDYISPMGSVGAWTRYTFYGIPDHTGHIYITFEDRGPDTSPLVGDNTRLANEPHGHLYRPAGRPVGFWLPPGVYPKPR